MKAFVGLTLALFLAWAPDLSRAHLFHPGQLAVIVYPADEVIDLSKEEITVALHVLNGQPDPVTLAGLWMNDLDRLQIEKERDFLLFTSWRTVDAVEIGPMSEIAIAPPTYRIKIPSEDWKDENLKIFGDFGEFGVIEAYAPMIE